MDSILPIHIGIEGYTLTKFELADNDRLSFHINDIEVYNNTLAVPFPYDVKDADEFITFTEDLYKKTGLMQNFAIRYQGEPMGGISLLYNHGIDDFKSEIGYWVSRLHRGKGIATAALKSLVQYAWEHTQLTHLEAHVFLGNVGSKKVCLNNGFLDLGIQKETFIKDGKFMDTHFLVLKKPNKLKSNHSPYKKIVM